MSLYQCFLTLPSVLVGNDFAISLQPLFSPRICCSFCSSSGVHGVLVLPFFFVAGSAGGSEGPVATAASAAVDVAVSAVEGEPPVFEARRLRGLVGEGIVAAWALELSAVTGGWLEEICADILVGDAAEADDLCRLCAGGDDMS